MKPLGWKNQIDLSQHAMSRISGALGQIKSSRHYVGWKSENIRPQERYFFLTSPFIELLRTYLLTFTSFVTLRYDCAVGTSYAHEDFYATSLASFLDVGQLAVYVLHITCTT